MTIDKKTKIKIAHWYYERGYTQEQIGKRLQIPRQRVNRIVKELVADGIVTIKINGLDREFVRLESAIEEQFHIRQVLVADFDGDTQLLHALGQKAAEFLDGFIKNGMTLGISWGFTVGEAVSSMRTANHPNCQVIQLVGSMDTQHHRIKPDEITRMLAAKLNCGYQNLYAPATFSSNYTREILSQEQSVMRVLSAMKHCDAAIMGIGELSDNSTMIKNGYITNEQREALCKGGYIGDICFNYYDVQGNWEKGDFSRLTLGVDHETLQKIPHVIAIAGGSHKRDAIIGALNTGCIDVLITDSSAACSIVESFS